MEIRRAEIGDIGELVRLRIAFMNETRGVTGKGMDSDIADSLKEYFKSTMPDDSFISWLALDNEKIVGTSGLCFYRLPPTLKNISGNVAYIMNMYTVPEYRNRGIAKLLFEKMIMEAQKRGYKKLCLHATDMGRPIYEKFGFKGVDTEMVLNL